ncbi:MAG: cell envelope integrity protein TolA [Alphaproteobacteria bacterium]|nr:cell envelope integrity protein TolA [Alphaproteobacteria bacterium]
MNKEMYYDRKKLFFGVSSKDVEKKTKLQKAEEEAKQRGLIEKQIAEQKRQQEEQLAKQKHIADNKYADDDKPSTGFDKLKHFISINTIYATTLFGLGNFCWLLVQSDRYGDVDRSGGLTYNNCYKPYKVAIHDAYIPTDKYYRYDYEEVWINKKPQFKLHIAWCLNVLFSLCGLAFSVYAIRHENDKYDTVDMMLELKKIGKQYNLSDRKIKKLWPVASNIIQKMSSDSRVYFDMLMNGDINIKDQEMFKKFAISIIQGHLESNPEDAQQVLGVFDERSIPNNLLQTIKAKTR